MTAASFRKSTFGLTLPIMLRQAISALSADFWNVLVLDLAPSYHMKKKQKSAPVPEEFEESAQTTPRAQLSLLASLAARLQGLTVPEDSLMQEKQERFEKNARLT